MKSLFNPTDNKEIIGRINRLTADTQAQWGKMNVAQMVAHLQPPLKVALGELKLKRNLVGVLFGGIAKKQLLKNESFKKNLPTDKSFIVQGHPDFEKEKQDIISLVQRFARTGPAGLSKEPHPFFGKLTTQEWDTLQWKHLDHHLRQFGV